MGKKNARKQNKHELKGNSEVDEISRMFKALPAQKRSELNKLVENLLIISSSLNIEATTAAKLWKEHIEIRELVDKICIIEKYYNINRPLPDRKTKFKPMFQWLKSLGAAFDSVDVEDYGEEGFGLKVVSPLKRGDVVTTTPRKAMMSIESAHVSSIGPLIRKDPMLQTMPNITLSLHLLIEKNSPASFWEPYINTLPHSYSTVLYFTLEEMDSLKGSPAYEESLRQYKNVARQYAYFYKLFQTTVLKDYFTYEEYRWAVSTVMTRQNHIPRTEEGQEEMINCLIPLWDMCNHEEGCVSTDYDDEKHRSVCMAFRDFAEGEQFKIYYGLRSNMNLLVHNGFVFEGNENDTLSLRLGVSKNDGLYVGKSSLLEKLKLAVTGNYYLRKGENPVDGDLLAFLRVFCMDEKELNSWSATEAKVEKLLDSNESSFSAVDERVWKFLVTRLQILLKSYPSTLNDDVQKIKSLLKKSSQSDGNKLMALKLLKLEKEILEQSIQYCQKMSSV